MRFSILSNSPWSPSGYGQQTRIFSHRLAALGHEIAIICYYGLEGGAMQIGERVICLPKRFHPYGNDIAVPHTQAYGGQFMLSLTDVWVMNPEDYPPGFKWVAWYPVDHDPIPPIVRAKLNSAWRRIAMSKFGVAQTHEAGMECHYIPHGVETGLLHPTSKAEARARLGLPQDRYIVGTVAMNKGNPSRKNFFEMLAAFAKFHEAHPEAFYLLQTDRGENMNDVVNLPELALSLGLSEGQDYAFCNQYQNTLGFQPGYFTDLYNSLDVHLLASAGEGFGIPTLEAQACGCPVIVGDWTASAELCFAGQKIPRSEAEPFWTGLASYQFRPHIGAVVAALEQEYKHPTDTREAVRYIQGEYDADKVVEKYWKPVLATIQEAL